MSDSDELGRRRRGRRPNFVPTFLLELSERARFEQAANTAVACTKCDPAQDRLPSLFELKMSWRRGLQRPFSV